LGSPRGIHSKNFNTHLTIEKYFDVPNNVVLDITPNLYSPESCKNASNEKAFLNSALFLIGGQGIGYSYEEAEWNQLIQNIIDFTKLTNSKATIVTSRRTDPSIEELLKNSLSNYFTDDSIWFHDGGANANLAELFGNATKIFVTEDSAMMISESISSGKKVTTLFPKSINTPARYSNHIQKYRDLNLIDSQSIKDQLSFEEGKDNIEKINLIREGLKSTIFTRIQL
jgi:mitochondrial fission protein ELM1